MPLTAGREESSIASQVPEGKGVSSSAAIETASMHAAACAFGIPLEPRDLALLCQKSGESRRRCAVRRDGSDDVRLRRTRRAAGAPLSARRTAAGRFRVPEDIELWGIDSGERHAVGGSDYGAVRAGAFMGLRILSEHASVPGRLSGQHRSRGVRARARSLSAGGDVRRRVPRPIRRHGGHRDDRGARTTISRACADGAPCLRAPACGGVSAAAAGVSAAMHVAVQLGELMYESHASYGRCGLGSPGTDRLVELVRAEGPAGGLYGARITGGGSGGTVAVIGRSDAPPPSRGWLDAYERATGYRAVRVCRIVAGRDGVRKRRSITL